MLKSRILFVLCGALTAFSANAVTICVNPAGSGGCQTTIQAAVNMAAAPGDIVKVAAGVYEETVTVMTAQAGLILMGAGVGKTIIDTAELATRALNVTAANDVTVAGISIRNSSPTEADAVLVSGNNFSFLKSEIANVRNDDCLDVTGTGLKVEKSVFRTCQGASGSPVAIRVNAGGDGASILKNRISFSFGSVAITGDGALFEGNLCESILSPCVAVTGDDAVVRKNKGAGQIVAIGATISGNDAQVLQNTFTNLVQGVTVVGNNARVEQNTLVKPVVQGVVVTGDDFSISRNTIIDAVAGIGIAGTCTVCTDAVVSDNKMLRVLVGHNLTFNGPNGQVRNNKSTLSAGGMLLAGTGAVLVEKNTSVGAAGLISSLPGFLVSGTGVKTLNKNKATNNGNTGFLIADAGAHVLNGNEAKNSGQNGFFLTAATNGVTMTGNKATGSGEEGIDNRGDNNIFSLNTAKGNRPGSDYCDETGNTGTAPAFAMLPGDNIFGSFTQTCIGEP